MKKNFFYNKFLPIISILLLILFIFNTYSFGFTDEENAKINEIVTTLNNNSKNNGVTWAIDTGCKLAYFRTDFKYNNKDCKYLVLMYWNSQYNVTLKNNVITAKNNEYSNHDICSYYFDSSLNLISAKCDNLSNYGSINFYGVNYLFKSNYTLTDGSGNTVNPYFPPQTITQILVEGTERVQIAEQLKIMIVGFLKYLIVLVISLIAFWKGWQFLSTQLRKA